MVTINYKIMLKLIGILIRDKIIDNTSFNTFFKYKESELLLPYSCKLSKTQFRNKSKYSIKFYHYNCEDYLNLRIRFKFLPELPYWYKKFNYNHVVTF